MFLKVPLDAATWSSWGTCVVGGSQPLSVLLPLLQIPHQRSPVFRYWQLWYYPDWNLYRPPPVVVMVIRELWRIRKRPNSDIAVISPTREACCCPRSVQLFRTVPFYESIWTFFSGSTWIYFGVLAVGGFWPGFRLHSCAAHQAHSWVDTLPAKGEG